MSDYLDALLEAVNRISDEKPADVGEWIDDVLAGFQLARAISDARTWLETAQGANSDELRSEMARSHEAVIRCLNILSQRAFMLWGVRIKTLGVPSKR